MQCMACTAAAETGTPAAGAEADKVEDESKAKLRKAEIQRLALELADVAEKAESTEAVTTGPSKKGGGGGGCGGGAAWGTRLKKTGQGDASGGSTG